MRQRYRVRRHSITQPQDESYRLIPLTRGQNAIVDAADFEWLNQWNWYASRFTGNYGFYPRRRLNDGTNILMHRLLLGLKDGEEGDHINRNPLDNRRCNLRKATPSENTMNRRTFKNNRCGVRGVAKRGDKYCARIHARGQSIWLGLFDNIEAAAAAYGAAAKKFHGEFANSTMLS